MTALDGDNETGPAHAAFVKAGLDDARATLAELWRRMDDDEKRAQAMRALKAVIVAEAAMRAADAFVTAKTRKARAEAYDALRATCILRVGADAVRPKP